MTEVVSIGTAVLDVLAEPVDENVFHRDSTRVESIKMSPGGDALNVATALSVMGVSTGIICRVGSGHTGQILLRHLCEAGIDVSRVATDPLHPSSTVVVLVGENGRRNFVSMKGAAHHFLSLSDIDPDYVKSAKIMNFSSYLGLSGFAAKDMVELLKLCRENSVTSCMDFMYDKTGEKIEGLARILPLLDYALPSKLEARQMSGKERVPEMARVLFEMGCRNVVIKEGERGCYIKTAAGEKRILAMPVEVVDSTGAGDSFVAGFIYGLLHDWPLESCGEFACRIGALNCRNVGGSAGGPSAQELTDYLPDVGFR